MHNVEENEIVEENRYVSEGFVIGTQEGCKGRIL